MRSTIRTVSASLVFVPFLAGCVSNGPATGPDARLIYPQPPRTNVVDDYFGTKVADPYRWMEDLDAPQTKAWVAAENKVTFAHLDQIPARAAIKRRLTRLWNYERYGVPFKEGGRYFFAKNDGLQNQSVLYTMTSLDGEPTLLLDPNKLSADGTVALSGYAISDDGNRMAYGLSTAGSDWQEWKVRDVRSGKDLSDDVRWVKFSGASWAHDGSGFFYSRYDEPKAEELKAVNYFQKLYFHRLGSPQSDDPLVYERRDHKDWGFGGEVTEDGRYLVIHVSQGTDRRNRVFYKDLSRPAAPVVELLNDFDAAYGFIGNKGPVFWFMTDLEAPRGRVIAIDVTHPARADWREVIPQAEETLRRVSLVDDQFIANYLKDAHSQVKIFRRDGRLERELRLPGVGSVSGFGGKRTDTETFYAFTSFTVPGTIYRYDLRTGRSSVFRQPKVDFDPADYVTRQVFYRSRDGTRVPMFITHRKGLKLDGRNPTLLYGYGGFDISLTPSFSVANVVWMEMGGVYAMANLRGGGEYGEAWHQAGMKLKKQNVFDDFIAAAEWLCGRPPSADQGRQFFVVRATKNGPGAARQNVIKPIDPPERFTRPARLAIAGGSNGGLLVGACETQRPELFGAALPAVGVMDMLRFQKFTIGWAWTSDYGSSDNAKEFRALYAYSPLQNIRPGTKYPATLITTADHDDRVIPAHSFKFAATLQAAQAGKAPVLIRIETRAGHGGGKPTSKLIDEAADRFGFLVRALRMKLPAAFTAAGGGD